MRNQQYDILVVNDDADDRMYLHEAFAELNFADRVTMYASVFDFLRALPMVRLLSPLPLLIILDYRLHGSSGAAILDLLQSDPLLRTVEVVVTCSAGMNPADKADCVKTDSVRYIEKWSVYEELRLFCRQVSERVFRTPPLGKRRSGTGPANGLVIFTVKKGLLQLQVDIRGGEVQVSSTAAKFALKPSAEVIATSIALLAKHHLRRFEQVSWEAELRRYFKQRQWLIQEAPLGAWLNAD